MVSSNVKEKSISRPMIKIMIVGAVFAFLSVAMGAFGAHAMKSLLSPYELGIYNTASQYQMIHSLALIIFGLLPLKRLWPAYCFIFGQLFFSGSLYLLAILHMPQLGMVTPIGGLLYLVGWSGVIIELYRESKS